MLCRSAVFRDARQFFTVTATLALFSFSTLADENDLNSQQLRRGAYLLRAAGCVACHTNSEHNGIFLAGGRALKTPFGTFYTPNITADPTHGIGNWTESDFVTAMTQGVAPNGTHYYPVFHTPPILELRLWISPISGLTYRPSRVRSIRTASMILNFHFRFDSPIGPGN